MGRGISRYQDYLASLGYRFHPNYSSMPWSWSSAEIDEIIRIWNTEERVSFYDSIVSRDLIRQGEGRYDEIDTKVIAESVILRVFAAHAKETVNRTHNCLRCIP